MYRTRVILIICFILSQKILLSQTQVGFRVDPIIYLANVDKIKEGPQRSESKYSEMKFGLIPCLSFSTSLDENVKISLRSGLPLSTLLDNALADRLYKGLETSLVVQIKISLRNYLISGFNLHLQSSYGGHTFSGNSLTLPYLILGYGIITSDVTSLELQLRIPFSKQSYGSFREYEEGTYYSIRHSYNVSIMLDISFGFDIEL